MRCRVAPSKWFCSSFAHLRLICSTCFDIRRSGVHNSTSYNTDSHFVSKSNIGWFPITKALAALVAAESFRCCVPNEEFVNHAFHILQILSAPLTAVYPLNKPLCTPSNRTATTKGREKHPYFSKSSWSRKPLSYFATFTVSYTV